MSRYFRKIVDQICKTSLKFLLEFVHNQVKLKMYKFKLLQRVCQKNLKKMFSSFFQKKNANPVGTILIRMEFTNSVQKGYILQNSIWVKKDKKVKIPNLGSHLNTLFSIFSLPKKSQLSGSSKYYLYKYIQQRVACDMS